MTGYRAGRIRADQRDTDNNASLLGANLPAPADLAKKYNETASCSMSTTCRRNYRNRIKAIINFWKENDPAYYNVGVRDVSESDRNDETKWYFPNSKVLFNQDIVYEALNSKFMLHFFVSFKIKKDSGLSSVENLRKYRDAIVWGSKVVGKFLPKEFYESTDSFITGYKKEYAKAKKQGKVEDSAADPITFNLYKLILEWAVDSNNILVWHWTQAQWTFMARSASIDPLHTDNFKLGSDSLIAKYDDSKTDKNAERLSEKIVYANPFE